MAEPTHIGRVQLEEKLKELGIDVETFEHPDVSLYR